MAVVDVLRPVRRRPADDECHLTVEDGWPCKEYTPGPDGRCTTPLPRPKGKNKDRLTCGHLPRCHDVEP